MVEPQEQTLDIIPAAQHGYQPETLVMIFSHAEQAAEAADP